MLIYALIFLASILCTQSLSTLPALGVYLGVLIILLCFHGVISLRKMKGQCALNYVIVFLLGFIWTVGFAQIYLNKTLQTSQEGKVLPAVGYIVSIPQVDDRHTQFVFKLTELAGKPISMLVKLSGYNQTPVLNVGDKWRLAVKLKRPHGTFNPGGFDQEKSYFKKRIRATGYVYKNNYQRLPGFLWTQWPNRLRQIVFKKISTYLKNQPFLGVLLALTIGDQSLISSKQWEVFRATGTSHLVAISGLHIGLVAGLFYFLINFLWRRSGFLMRMAPAQEIAGIASLLGGFFYSLLAGFALPTQRALFMLSLFVLVVLARRFSSVWKTFAFALLIVLLIDPLSTLSSSFWLSFSAVFMILYVASNRAFLNKSLWARFGKVQFALTLGLLPVTLFFFQQASIIAFFANLIAVPFLSFSVIPMALLGVIAFLFSSHLGTFLLLCSGKLLGIIWVFLNKMASFHAIFLHQTLQNNWIFLSAVLGVLLLLAPKGLPGRWLGVFTFLPLFFYASTSPGKGEVMFTLLDVGQGLSSVVRTQHHVLVFDTGAKYSDHFDMGDAVALPFLRKMGVKKIDVLMLSHSDNDHIGGAKSILENMRVNRISTSIPNYFEHYKAEYCYEGQHWVWDEVHFRVLYPPKGLPYQGNNSSCVLQVQTGKTQILMTGDAEKGAEYYLLAHQKRQLPSRILVAGHHGSKTSSTTRFVEAVNPQYVLFAAGYLNSYHFPHAIVVQRYLKQGSVMENTADAGAVSFTINRQTGIVEHNEYRTKAGHYWNLKTI